MCDYSINFICFGVECIALCNVERGSETSLCLIQWLGILISIIVTQKIVKNIEN